MVTEKQVSHLLYWFNWRLLQVTIFKGIYYRQKKVITYYESWSKTVKYYIEKHTN